MLNMLRQHRIHVMDQRSIVDLVALYTQVTTIVSDNYIISKTSPFSRSIELLVDVTIETESHYTDLSGKRQITESLFERVESSQFRVSKNLHELSSREEAA